MSVLHYSFDRKQNFPVAKSGRCVNIVNNKILFLLSSLGFRTIWGSVPGSYRFGANHSEISDDKENHVQIVSAV